jgi:hypothetical protein
MNVEFALQHFVIACNVGRTNNWIIISKGVDGNGGGILFLSYYP